jgi:hypothetical protein
MGQSEKSLYLYSAPKLECAILIEVVLIKEGAKSDR